MLEITETPGTITALGTLSFLFTDCSQGNMSLTVGDTTHTVDNRRKLLAHLPQHARHVTLRAQHASTVQYADKDIPITKDALGYEYYECDALIANVENTAIWMFPADCICLVLYSAASPIACLVHVSRKTLECDLLPTAIDQYTKISHTSLHDINAHMSPHVRADSYIFPKELASTLFDNSWKQYMKRTPNDTVSIDITKRLNDELNRGGISAANISESHDNTANGHYYSQSAGHKNHALRGRNAAVLFTSN